MPFLDFLRRLSMMNQGMTPDNDSNQIPIGNDLPSQGGITGTMPRPVVGPSDSTMISPAQTSVQTTGIRPVPTEDGSLPIPGDPTANNGSINNLGTWKLPTSMGNNPARQSVEDQVNSIVNRIYTPEHFASDRVNQMLNEFPVRQEPTGLRKLGAFFVGLGGKPEEMDHALYGNYDRNLKDWQARFGPAYQAGNLERYSNANERQMASQTATAITAEERARTQQEAEDRRREQGDKRLQLEQDKREIERSIAGNRFKHAKESADGYYHVIDDANGTDVKTNVRIADLTGLEKEEWIDRHIIKRGEQARLTQKEKPVTEKKPTIVYNTDSAGTHPHILGPDNTAIPITDPSGHQLSSKITSEAQLINQLNRRAAELIADHPNYAQYIIIEKGLPPVISEDTPDEDREALKGLLYTLRSTEGDINIDPNSGRVISPDEVPPLNRPGASDYSPKPPTTPANTSPSGKNSPFIGPIQPKTNNPLRPLPNQTNNPNLSPPPGAKPGGKWMTTSKGNRVYKEP